MAYPNFSEFSFGYAVVRQIEDAMAGRLAVPTFPTQVQEATKGYDVEFLSHGVPLFIQFKRSEVMSRRSCKEYKDLGASWKLPSYRMHLHSRDEYRQDMLLRDLEKRGKAAVYCTSKVRTKDDLDDLHSKGRIFDAATVFWPSQINLPSLHEQHHVAFAPGQSRAYVYSGVGQAFEMQASSFDDLFATLRPRAETSVDAELGPLTSFVEEALDGRLDARAEKEREGARQNADKGGATIGRPAYDDVSSEAETTDRRERIARVAEVESVVKQAALIAYYEMDAFLVSISRKQLRK